MKSIVRANPVTANSTLIYDGASATEEQRLGQRQAAIPEFGRIQAPEDANADMALGAFVSDPGSWMESAIDQVPAVIGIEGDFTVFSTDFNVLANFQYVRAGADLVGSEGRNDQTTYQFITPTPGLYRCGQPFGGGVSLSAPNLLLGFQIEWGVNLLDFQPFTMEVSTHEFKGSMYQPVDRSFTLRVGGNSKVTRGGNSGIFQALFGQRLTSSNTCGYPGSAGGGTVASSGMNKAIAQPAKLLPFVDSILSSTGAQIYIPGASNSDSTLYPYVEIKIPPALAGAFGVTMHLLTAASPYLASTREALFLDQ